MGVSPADFSNFNRFCTQCPGRGSNPYAPCGAPDFKSGASASSATQACDHSICYGRFGIIQKVIHSGRQQATDPLGLSDEEHSTCPRQIGAFQAPSRYMSVFRQIFCLEIFILCMELVRRPGSNARRPMGIWASIESKDQFHNPISRPCALLPQEHPAAHCAVTQEPQEQPLICLALPRPQIRPMFQPGRTNHLRLLQGCCEPQGKSGV
jgi:hypothetical protein